MGENGVKWEGVVRPVPHNFILERSFQNLFPFLLAFPFRLATLIPFLNLHNLMILNIILFVLLFIALIILVSESE
jgi:hypothetical protein